MPRSEVRGRWPIALFIQALLTLSSTLLGCAVHPATSATGHPGGSSSAAPTVRVMEGAQDVPTDLLVPKDTVLLIRPGAHLRMGPNVRIRVEGRIIAQGTKDKPIVFSAARPGTYWRGIKINGSELPPELDRFWLWLTAGDPHAKAQFFDKIQRGNWFEHCVFENLATAKQQWERNNKWLGAIEGYDTALRVRNSRFDDVLYFGAVLAQRSYLVVDDNLFDSKTLHKAINGTDRVVGVFHGNTIRGHRTENFRCADGIWVKSFVGLISSNHIESVADDGLDLDRSRTIAINNEITGAHDDGIDVSNEGIALLIRNRVSGISENGILVSNGSRALLDGDSITRSPAGLTARDGGWATGRHLQISDNRTGVLLFQQVPCALSQADYLRIKSQIKAMPLEEIRKQQEIRVVRKAKDLASSLAIGDFLDRYYVNRGERAVLTIDKPQSLGELDDLRKLFKLVDIFGTEYVTSADIAADPTCQALKTRVDVCDSSVTQNRIDVGAYHGYEMAFTSTQFSDETTAREVAAKSKPISLASNVEMNPGSLETSTAGIVRDLDNLGVTLPIK